MLGACVGDAAGAVLEFIGRAPTAQEVEHALTMPGGGRTHVGPGQITDDGELTLALWSALYKHKPKDGPPVDKMLEAYSRWYKSEPHDMGVTCSMAFEMAEAVLDGQRTIESYLSQVEMASRHSQANGALMRATALAHWASRDDEVPPSMVALMGRVDSQLSHPNMVCQECNSLYLYAATLLLRGVAPLEAYKKTGEFAIATVSSQEVLKWFFNDSQDITRLDCRTNIGHVRWGFCLAFYFLQNPHIDFEEALRLTLLKGGDTDTNAAIVGGLVGCYREIPEKLKKPVLLYRADGGGQKGHVRPAWLWPWSYFS
jgi:ADP-ribosyl-[dinitrogen reductase] hydrolase